VEVDRKSTNTEKLRRPGLHLISAGAKAGTFAGTGAGIETAGARENLEPESPLEEESGEICHVRLAHLKLKIRNPKLEIRNKPKSKIRNSKFEIRNKSEFPKIQKIRAFNSGCC